MRKIVAFVFFSFLVILPSYAQYPDFTSIIEQSSPSVVKINTVQTIRQAAMPQIPQQEIPEIFRDFFDRQYRAQPREARALGSGFIISEDGYILTNNHVVGEADTITVRLLDRREFNAEVVGTDPRSDLALIKIDAKGLQALHFAQANQTKVGEWVVAIGSPFGLDFSASVGIISAIGRSLPTEKGENYVPFLQSDVAINPGNSGGPLLNMAGEVVGINSQIFTRSGGSIGLSFSIPAGVAEEVVQQLKEKGHVDRGWLGVYIQDVDQDLAKSLGLKNSQGALIAQVEPGGPADDAGIEAGDVIVKMQGKTILDSGDLPHVVGLITPGTKVEVTLFRKGKEKTLHVKVGALPGDDSAGNPMQTAEGDRLGIETRDLDDSTARNWRIPGGVVVTNVYPDSPAEKADLQQGDVIVQLGYTVIDGIDSYQDVLKGLPSNTPVAIRFIRKGISVFRTIELE